MINPRKLIAFLPLLLALCIPGYGQTDAIGILINSPSQTPAGHPVVVGNNLNLVVDVPATYQIDSVIASVPGAQPLLLTYNTTSGEWTGTISLVGLPMDTTTLTIRAVDIYNNSATSTGLFIYDLPPTVSLDSPAAYTVAVPDLHVRSRCSSASGPCTITVALANSASVVTLGAYTDSVDTNFDLTADEGLSGAGTNSMMLEVSATDRYGVGANLLPYVPVYAETSPYLTPVFTTATQIYDLSNNKVFAMLGGVGSNPYIADITTGSVTNIPFTGYVTSLTPHLTSTGAVFPGESVSEAVPGGWSNFFEWHNGSLDSLGQQNDINTNLAAGDYGTVSDYPGVGTIVYRNFATQTNQTLPFNAITGISPSGSVLAYETTGSKTNELIWHLYSFATASSSVAVDDSSGYAYLYGSMATDGTHVIYPRVNPSTEYSSTIFGGSGNYFDTLATFPPSVTGSALVPSTINGYFLINNGYSAYLAPDNQGRIQTWVRDTTGKKMQISSFNGNGNGGKLEYLDPAGGLSYLTPGQVISPGQQILPTRAIYTPGAGSASISGIEGQAYYMDSAWYVVIGRTVFKLNLTITPNKSDNFTVNVKPNSAYGFTSGSFDAHFEGSGYPTKIAFTRLPSHGTFTVQGVSGPLYFANSTVSRASLQTLVYTPTTGFTGVDTVYWYGSTDFTTSVDTGMLLLNVGVGAAPAQPVITGLDTAYCGNGGPALFKMTNFPDTTGGALVVTDSLDNKPLAIGAGATCSIALSGLSAGVHTLKVTYTNAGGSSVLFTTFDVVAPANPTVGVSASYTTMPDTAGSVVVRVNDVSGGGTLPQYTFSLHPNFSPVLYGPGGTDSVVIDSAALAVGGNKVYVRMQTSDSCYTALNATDSIVITRTADTTHGGSNGGGNGVGNGGGNTNDSTSSSLSVGPNPFQDQLFINGLQASHAYIISLLNGNGSETVRVQVDGVTSTTFFAGAVPSGIYLLRIYDTTTGKTSRLVRLMGLRK